MRAPALNASSSFVQELNEPQTIAGEKGSGWS